ncbi:hypothetical protein [Bradyrhizobium sp. 1(2017)]|uniref:hypothetical protein n=1 Tax=Bradyrhizobium sp. 1(2017) TaxID=1404888 RepID=UPI00140EE8C8|nr:hypothetical protein [Bradyrhizobium sp. 1(2017)]QIO35533.1 hypothetical protein HAP40_28860 [Bradyrhizobium sp. 1(2017)]
MLRAADRARVARLLRFSDVDEGFTRDQIEAAQAGIASTLTIVAMMPFCPCFARRVNSDFAMSETAESAQVFDPVAAGYCAWGCFRIFCCGAALSCRAAECRRANAIANSGATAIHDRERAAPTSMHSARQALGGNECNERFACWRLSPDCA